MLTNATAGGEAAVVQLLISRISVLPPSIAGTYINTDDADQFDKFQLKAIQVMQAYQPRTRSNWNPKAEVEEKTRGFPSGLAVDRKRITPRESYDLMGCAVPPNTVGDPRNFPSDP